MTNFFLFYNIWYREHSWRPKDMEKVNTHFPNYFSESLFLCFTTESTCADFPGKRSCRHCCKYLPELTAHPEAAAGSCADNSNPVSGKSPLQKRLRSQNSVFKEFWLLQSRKHQLSCFSRAPEERSIFPPRRSSPGTCRF